MVGRATLTMKKSMRGSAAASSTVKSPRPPSEGGAAVASAALCEVMVSVTVTSLRPLRDWYQSVLILVAEAPGNRVGTAAGWRHDDHGPGDDDHGSADGDRSAPRHGRVG